MERHGIIGSARLVPGRRDRAVLEMHEEHPRPGNRINIVLTMADGRVVAMEQHRRASKARRLADVSPTE